VQHSATFKDVPVSLPHNNGSVARTLVAHRTLTNAVRGRLTRLSAHADQQTDACATTTIVSDTEWTLSGSPYVLNCYVQVSKGATLTVDPGVIVEAGGNAGLYIQGTLLAQGTSDAPITFRSTSDNPSSGDWTGLFFDGATASGSQLSYVTVQGAGRSYGGDYYGYRNSFGGWLCNTSGLVGPSMGGANGFYCNTQAVLLRTADPSFDHVTIHGSQTDGLYVMGNVPALNLTNSTFDGNAGYAIHLENIASLPTQVGTLSLGVNGNPSYPDAASSIAINGGVLPMSTSVTATEALTYTLLGYPTIAPGASLSLAPGSVVLAGGNTGLYIRGALLANGTPDAPITFRSSGGNPSRGDWTGLFFDGAAASDSQLTYVTIRDAGRSYGGDYYGYRNSFGGWLCNTEGLVGPDVGGANGFYCYTQAVLLRTADPTFDHVTIRDSATDGLYVIGDVPALNLTNVGFDNNGGYAIHLENIASLPAQVGTLSLGVNGTASYPAPANSIAINGGVLPTNSTVTAVQPLTYTLLGYPTIAPGATLSLAPGSVVLAGGNTGLYVRGTLLAAGTSNAPITFRSSNGSSPRGDWSGLFFDGVAASTSQLSYVTVLDAGRSYGGDYNGYRNSFGGWLCNTTGLVGPSVGGANGFYCDTQAVLLRTADPSFDHLTVRDSATDGLYAASDVPPLNLTNASFDNNGGYAIHLENIASLPAQVGTLSLGVNGGGGYPNPASSIAINGGLLPTNSSVTATEALTYTLLGYPTIASGASLSLAPGSVVLAGGNTGLYVQGTLDAQGTENAPITFRSTSANPSRGDWTGLFLDGTTASASHLSYVTIQDAGRNYGGDYYGYRNSFGGWLCNTAGLVGPAVGGANGFYCITAALLVNNASPTLSHLTVSTINGQGLYLQGSATEPRIDHLIAENTIYQGVYAAGDVPTLRMSDASVSHTATSGGYAMQFDSLDTAPIDVSTLHFGENGPGGTPNAANSLAFGGVLSTGHTDEWTQALTYTLLSYPTISPGASLSLAPGSTVFGGGNAGLYVRGTLRANGTGDAPITFRSMSGDPSCGGWTGLFFDGSAASDSRLSHVTIQDAGRSYGGDYNGYRNSFGGWLCNTAGLVGPGAGGANGFYCYTQAVLLRAAAPTFDHLTVRNSQTDGLYAMGDVPSLPLTNANFDNNGGYAIHLENIASLPAQVGTLSLGVNGTASYPDPASSIAINGGVLPAGVSVTATESLTYTLLGYPTIAPGASLSLKPGSTVLAGGNTGLYVQGTLDAQGSENAPIVFRSTSGNPSRGDWTGLFFDGASASTSRLSYVTVLDAGRSYGGDYYGYRNSFGGWLCNTAGLVGPGVGGANGFYCYTDAILLRTAAPAFDHLTISDSATDGLYATGDVPALNLTNARFDDNAGYAIHLENIGSLPTRVGTISLGNNGNFSYPEPANSIAINGGVLPTNSIVTAVQPLTYTLLGYPTIAPGATLSLAPGSVVLAGGNTGLYVRGTLLAAGTSDAPITFRSSSVNPSRGDWSGLFFDGAAAATSRLSYVTVLDAGRSYGGDYYGYRNSFGGWLCNTEGLVGPDVGGSNGFYCYTQAVLLRASSPTFDHLTVRDSATDGLYAMDDVPPLNLTNARFDNDAGYAIHLQNIASLPTQVGTLSLGVDGSGVYPNPASSIAINGGVLPTNSNVVADQALTYTLLGYPTIASGASLSFAPGSVVLAGGNTGLYVRGTLTANGTSDAPITFRSVNGSPSRGDWTGIFLDGAGSSGSQLTNVTIQDAGRNYGGDYYGYRNSFGGWQCNTAGLVGPAVGGANGFYCVTAALLLNNSSPSLDHLTLRHGNGQGLYLTNNSAPTLDSATIEDNASYGVVTYGSRLHISNSSIDKNSAVGLAIDGASTVLVDNSTIVGNTGATGGGISNGGTLTLASSTVSGNSAQDAGGVYNAGTLTVEDSVLAGNSAASGATDCSGALVSKGYNILGNTTSCTGLTAGQKGDQVGTGAHAVDPQLDTLRDNGGPTWTMAPLPGSPAIGGGDPHGCVDALGQVLARDQRGLPRIMDPFVKTLGRGNLRWRHLLSPADWQGCVHR